MWYATLACKPRWCGRRSPTKWWIYLQKALRTLGSKGDGRTSIHHNAELVTAMLLLRIIVSVNQLSIYRAVADRCQDLAVQIAARSPPFTETPVANVEENPTCQVHQKTYRTSTNHHFWDFRARGNSVRQHEEKFENHPEDLQLPNLFANFFFRNVSQGQLFVSITDIHLAGYGCTSSCREYTPKLVWFWLSWSQNVFTIVEWKSRSNLCRKRRIKSGWLSAGCWQIRNGAFWGKQ